MNEATHDLGHNPETGMIEPIARAAGGYVASEPNLPSGPNYPGMPPAVGRNEYTDKKAKAGAVPRAWDIDEPGRHGKPIEYDGQQFFYHEVATPVLRQFNRAQRRVMREQADLSQKHEIELRNLARYAEAEKKAAIERGEDEPFISLELPEDRIEYYEGEADRLSDEWHATYDSLLRAGIVGWNLPRPFDIDVVLRFSKIDKVALCKSIGERSANGIEAAKN